MPVKKTITKNMIIDKAISLIEKQVVCVCNFTPIRIGDVKSEVRILGSDTLKGCILLTSISPVSNGSKVVFLC